MELSIIDGSGQKTISVRGCPDIELEFYREYQPGDKIQITLDQECLLKLQLDQNLGTSLVYGKAGDFLYPIPSGEDRAAYPPEAFQGACHKVKVSYAEQPEGIVNLSENIWDIRGATNLYPHCTATVETRGEAVFAARNTIDGMTETAGHGIWPFTSWGEGEDPDARIRIDFGRMVQAEEVQIFLRADFPHDNYWKTAELEFSDGTSIPVFLEKTGDAQHVPLGDIRTEWIVMKNLVKDEEDPSPFPALTQWKVFGRHME